MKKHFYLFILLLIPYFSIAQKYLKHPFKWPAVPQDLEVNEQFKTEDVVLLLDENEINFRSEEVSRHMILKINTQNGINKSVIKVPDSFDPEADKKDVHILKKQILHRPKLADNELIYFVARIIKPDGRIVDAQIKEDVQKESFLVSLKERNYNAYFFSFLNATAGDVIETYYCYSLPINFNNRMLDPYLTDFHWYSPSYSDIRKQFSIPYSRLFFHSDIAKQLYKLDFIFNPNKNVFVFDYPNYGEYLDSVTDVSKNLTKLTWKKTDLYPCTNEPGARLYKDLPHVHFYLHNKDYGLKDEVEDNNYIKYLPYPWSYALLKDIGYKPEPYVFQSKRSSIRAFEKMYQNIKDTLKDTSVYNRLAALHREITNNFSYQNDLKVISGEDNENMRIDKFLNEKIHRAWGGSFVYEYLLDRSNAEYYILNLTDNRINEIGFQKFFPVISTNSFYALKEKGNLFYFRPKKHRFGMYINELPFYFENTNVVLVPQDLNREDYYKNVYNVNYIFKKTPGSSERENVRNVFVSANVNADSSIVRFTTKVELKGQFSTMCRGAYLYDYMDTSANPQYHYKVWDFPGCQNPRFSIVKQSETFPYQTVLKAFYTMNLNWDNSNPTFNLEGLISHIILEDLHADQRKLKFYPDFRQHDNFVIMLNFDKPYKLLNDSELNEEIENSFGKYMFKATQVSEQQIKIESMLIVRAESVPAKEVVGVEKIYSDIRKNNTQKLKLKKI